MDHTIKLGNTKKITATICGEIIKTLTLEFENQRIHLLPSEITHLKKILEKFE